MNNDAISVLDMQIQDANSEYLGVSRQQLMENAGAAVAKIVSKDPNYANSESILVLCGTGGNGGDGLVAARHLSRYKKVKILVLGDIEKTRSPPTKHNWETTKCLLFSIQKVVAKQKGDIPQEWFKGSIVIIDAILGTGTRGKLREPIRSAVQLTNKAVSEGVPVYAVDCPTGMDPQTGQTKGEWIRASCTIALHQKKVGLTKATCGEIVVVNIGIPKETDYLVGPGDLLAIPRRIPEAHKGDSGKILVIGGSQDYTGAPALVGLAALRGGADLVIIAAPREVENPIRSYSPELIVRGFEGSSLLDSTIRDIKTLIEWADVVVVGPGLGTGSDIEKGVQNLVSELRTLEKPTIIDADALKYITKDCVGEKMILTPHSGEFLILTGKKLPPISKLTSKRWKLVEETARGWNCTFLVKGKWDIIASPKSSKINLSGCPEMSVGGTGDVLAGLTAALYALCKDPFRSAAVAAFLNGKAGELTLKKTGCVSSDQLVQQIPLAIREAQEFI